MTDIWESLPEESTLKSCGPGGFAALAARWTELSVGARAPIVSLDDPPGDVFFVLSGRVRAATYAATGREVAFSELTAGDSFGEIAAIDGGPRSTNVTALTETRLARLSSAAFNEVVATHPDVLTAMLRYLAGRVRALSTRMLDVTTLNARQRLISLLLNLAQRSGEDTAVIEALPTQQDLADTILGQREAVGRDMSRLRSDALIRREGRQLTILSVSGLRSALEDG